MHERLKASEVGQIECQTCEKKIYVVKKILGKIFLKFFSWNLILIYILNYFYHFQPFSYYKKCAYLKEVIRRDSDQCGLAWFRYKRELPTGHIGFSLCLCLSQSTHKYIKKKKKMKVATAAFLVLCTLVAIGLVSSASK